MRTAFSSTHRYRAATFAWKSDRARPELATGKRRIVLAGRVVHHFRKFVSGVPTRGGQRYKRLGTQYLDDEYFNPLAEGRNNFAGRHAYSHVNALCSAMQAYLTIGSAKHLNAATNAFDFLTAQSFATGGWGPDEALRAPDSNDVYTSLTNSHSSFETPCGSYAHFKLTRYLLRVTRDPRYGDSMERVMYNTVLGAKPLRADGSTFYYSDYHFKGRKVYSDRRWACCSGHIAAGGCGLPDQCVFSMSRRACM